MTSADRTTPPPTAAMRRAGAAFADALQQATQQVIKSYDASPAGRSDVMSVVPAALRTWAGLATNPLAAGAVTASWASRVSSAWGDTVSAAYGRSAPITGEGKPDGRFADPAWEQNPAFRWLRQSFENWQRAVGDYIDAAGLTEGDRRKTRFLAQSIVDGLAPSNFAATNPLVLKRAIETGGASLTRGLQNFLDDLVNNGGHPRQVAVGGHEVGRNLAVTPGKVVFRNDLMELIQYSPTTESVYEIPLLFSPPWINKYYIMDLAPGRSLVEWAVKHGHTVFAISYRNPDETMRDVSMDDYLLSGPLAALDVISDITGSQKVNVVGLCLGGTLTMATLAYLDRVGDDRINSATFLNTLIDFSEPGDLGMVTDEGTVQKLELVMQKTGFLPERNMSRTFDFLRSKDLIWNYVVSNWLLGEHPPEFDILTWNADSTRMPAVMHSYYLRHCYLQNELAQGRMELAGQQLDVRAVDQDIYVLAAEQDHIAPWRSSYAGARLPSGNVRFVLSNSGHIAGIVNPPNPKAKHWVSPDGSLPESADEWRASAAMTPTTWWDDWAWWVSERAGQERTPPGLGNDRYPALSDAPGTYVHNA